MKGKRTTASGKWERMIKEKISLKASKLCASSQRRFSAHIFSFPTSFESLVVHYSTWRLFFFWWWFHFTFDIFLTTPAIQIFTTTKNTIYFFSALRFLLIFDVVRFSFGFFFHLHDTEWWKEKAKQGEMPPMKKKSLSSVPHFHTCRRLHIIFSSYFVTNILLYYVGLSHFNI